jgi:transcriptional regulator with XRE-family HTH domain
MPATPVAPTGEMSEVMDDKTKPPELTLSLIEDLKAKGYTQSDIAKMFGVTRQAVSWHKRTYNGKRTPRQQVLEDNFPWKVDSRFIQSNPFRSLRDYGEWFATGGKGLADIKLRRAQALIRKLMKNNAVLEYDPELSPIEGVSVQGGFALRPRRRQDGDLMIRVNKHTTITEQGRLIWRMPVEVPQPYTPKV